MEKNVEKNQDKTGFTTIDKALQYDLFTRLKELRDGHQELGEFCIVDRFNSSDFISVFQDGINSYRPDTILCERLFKKDLCSISKRQTYSLPDEAIKVSNEFNAYINSISWNEIDQAGIEMANKKTQEYKEKLNEPSMQPKLTDIDVLVYKEGDFDLLVKPLKEFDDEQLNNYCVIIAKFVVVYYLTMRIMLTTNFKLQTTPIKSGDYIDLISIIELL